MTQKNDIKLALVNWKTSLSGLLGFLLTVPIFVQAIEDLANHKPVNWILVALGCGMAWHSHGLLQAKDSTTHSTLEETRQATLEEERQATLQAQAAAAPAKDLPGGRSDGPAAKP